MARTQGRMDCDTGFEDGIFDLSASDFFNVGAGAATLTRQAKGDVSWNMAPSLTGIFDCALSGILFRTGLQDYLQEKFGGGGVSNNPFGSVGNRFSTPTTQSTANATAAGNGVAVNLAVKYSGLFVVGRNAVIDVGANQEVQIITAIPDATHITVAQLTKSHTSVFNITQDIFRTPAGVTGLPPFTGVTQFTPPASRPKGILIRGFELRYLISVANLTSLTVGLSQTIFQNATALAITDIIAPTALAAGNIAFAATPYVVPLAVTSPVFLTSDLSEYILEITVVTPASSTFRLYGATLYATFNYN